MIGDILSELIRQIRLSLSKRDYANAAKTQSH
jgi:hypothetical protein